MAIAVWLRDRFGSHRLRNTARFAITFTAFAVFLKLLVLLHPNMPLGDALFHAHRFQDVLDGTLYFTSVAPGHYNFPYAPGLYVAAAPFAGLASRGLGNVTLLRVFVIAADALAGLLIYFAVARAWGDRLTAAIAVALHHLIPLGFGIVLGGTLTNVFAQSMSVFALVVLALPWVSSSDCGVGLLAGALAAAITHTGPCDSLDDRVVTAALRGAAAPARDLRRCGRTAGVANRRVGRRNYGHFIETAPSWRADEAATAAPDAPKHRDRAARCRDTYLYLGVPNLLLAAGARPRFGSGIA